MIGLEIGSEFHFIGLDSGSGIRFPRSGSLTFSGRTAIEAVLKKLPHCNTALLPSYCCDSMIEPFRRAGVSVSFFDVGYNGSLTVNVSGKADILLWCNYFGFKNKMPGFDGVVIEDITHSLLSDVPCDAKSDYLVASVRKWMPIYCGGYCSVESDLSQPPEAFVKEKSDAMKLKSEYLRDCDEDKKQIFLPAFGQSNKWLADNYSGLGIDGYSKEYISCADVETQSAVRRRNAHILYDGLDSKVDFLFDEKEMDCPLFVPIVLPKGRDSVRRHLTENKIYCPVHWPHPKAECDSVLYDAELSLICDQRYTESDMERLVEVLKKCL